MAELTEAAGEVKRNRDAIASLETLDVLAGLEHRRTHFMAHHTRDRQIEACPRPVFLPQVPVAATDAAGIDTHERIGITRLGIGKFLNLERLAERSYHGGFHGDAPGFFCFKRDLLFGIGRAPSRCTRTAVCGYLSVKVISTSMRTATDASLGERAGSPRQRQGSKIWRSLQRKPGTASSRSSHASSPVRQAAGREE
jgi:hypothetical protein